MTALESMSPMKVNMYERELSAVLLAALFFGRVLPAIKFYAVSGE